jgi:hypothetical protein
MEKAFTTGVLRAGGTVAADCVAPPASMKTHALSPTRSIQQLSRTVIILLTLGAGGAGAFDAAEFFETTQARLEQLAAIGKVHAVKSAGGALWLCINSL